MAIKGSGAVGVLEARGVGVSDRVTVGVLEGLEVDVGSWAVSVGRGVSEATGIVGVGDSRPSTTGCLAEEGLGTWVSPVAQPIAPDKNKTNRAARTPY